MGKHERNDFVRPKESYDTTVLCAYMRDILLTRGDTSGDGGRVSTGWDSELANVHVLCNELYSENPIFRMDVHDNRFIGHRRTYVMSHLEQTVTMYDETHTQMYSDTPIELVMQLMQYLRTCPRVEEPLTTPKGEATFQRIAANIAIEQAVSDNNIDMWSIAMGHNTEHGHELYISAQNRIMEKGVPVANGEFAPFTRSPYYIQQELARIVYDINQNRGNRVLPPGASNIKPTDEL